MTETTGIERFIAIMGGPDSIPPEVETPSGDHANLTAQDQHQPTHADPIDRLPSVEEVIAMNREHKEAARASRNRLQAERRASAPTKAHFTAIPASEPFKPADSDLQFDSRVGQVAPKGIKFTPFDAVLKFCYRFVPKKWMQVSQTLSNT
jgi:hypothetical protein